MNRSGRRTPLAPRTRACRTRAQSSPRSPRVASERRLAHPFANSLGEEKEREHALERIEHSAQHSSQATRLLSRCVRVKPPPPSGAARSETTLTSHSPALFELSSATRAAATIAENSAGSSFGDVFAYQTRDISESISLSLGKCTSSSRPAAADAALRRSVFHASFSEVCSMLLLFLPIARTQAPREFGETEQHAVAITWPARRNESSWTRGDSAASLSWERARALGPTVAFVAPTISQFHWNRY